MTGSNAASMKIGITCYPTYGGSGVVATELGIELAARGHEIHFISYAMPIRLSVANERIFFHEVEVTSYPLFDHPPYTLGACDENGRSGRKGFARSAARSLCDSAFGERAAGADDGGAETTCRLSPRCTAPTLRWSDSDRSYLPITRFSIEQSDGVTAISNYLRDGR